ncbi:MAG: hypothetical protein HYR94_28890 [Chloroflexi bacterium]|nr:hypothetical protein [Chloroflexota bacterium]
MKVHKANRYLLITSTIVSETVKNQLKALLEDQSNSRMATFWVKNDLIRFLGQYSDIYNRHFSSWEKQAVEAANLIQKHHFSAHRGAILWCPSITAVFGNDGYSLQEGETMNEEIKEAILRTRREVEKFRELIQGKRIEEIAFGISSNNYTWVMLVRSNSVYELNDLIWTCYPSGGSNNRFQREDAFSSIWMFLNSPLKETC